MTNDKPQTANLVTSAWETEISQPMLASESAYISNGKHIEVDDLEAQEQATSLKNDKKAAKLSCYLELVSIAYEKTVTLWVDIPYRKLFNAQLPQAIFASQKMGLTAAEIDAAIQIGEFRGNRVLDMMPIIYTDIPEVEDIEAAPLSNPQMNSSNEAANEGFRARLRRERTQVRTRH